MIVTILGLIFALGLILQGVHVLRTGIIVFFLVRPASSTVAKGGNERVRYALFYLGCGMLILGMLSYEALQSGTGLESIGMWAHDRAVPLLAWVSILVVGYMLVRYPTTGLGWVRKAYPEIRSEDKRVLFFLRILGLLFLYFAVIFLNVIIKG
jgi:hypothetical protein